MEYDFEKPSPKVGIEKNSLGDGFGTLYAAALCINLIRLKTPYL
jgi:hypothetical protein